MKVSFQKEKCRIRQNLMISLFANVSRYTFAKKIFQWSYNEAYLYNLRFRNVISENEEVSKEKALH